MIIAVLLIRFIRWLLSLALRFTRWAVPRIFRLALWLLVLGWYGGLFTEGKKRGHGHRLLPLARLLRPCVMEAENRHFSGVCAPPFQSPSPTPLQPFLPPPFRTPVQTPLPTLIQTHLHTPLGTLLGTPLQTPFPPLFRQVCATFFFTFTDTSGKSPNSPGLPPFRSANPHGLLGVFIVEPARTQC